MPFDPAKYSRQEQGFDPARYSAEPADTMTVESLLGGMPQAEPEEGLRSKLEDYASKLNVNIPRIPAEYDPRGTMSQVGLGLTPDQRLAVNLMGGGAELIANLPAFAADLILHPEQLSPVAEGKLQVPPILKEIVRPAAKLAAGMTVKEESKAGRELYEEAIKEAFEHPEGPLLPFLIAMGGPKPIGKLARRIKGVKHKVRPVDIVEKVEPIKSPYGDIPAVEVKGKAYVKEAGEWRQPASGEKLPSHLLKDAEAVTEGISEAIPRKGVKPIPIAPEPIAEKPKAPPLKVAKAEVAETPKEAVAEIIEGKRESTLGTAEFKKRMVSELDKAIEKSEWETSEKFWKQELRTYDRDNYLESIGARAKPGYEGAMEPIPAITIRIPGDGEFMIPNRIESLSKVKEKIAKLPDVEFPKKKGIDWGAEGKPPSVRGTGIAGGKKALEEAMERGEVTFEPTKGKKPSERGAVLNPFREVATATSEMIQKAKAPPEITAGVKKAKEAMIEHDRQIRRAESTSRLFENTVNKNIPKDKQMTMVHAYEHKMQGKYWDQLSPLEQKITEWAAGEKAKLNQFIKENDVLEMMPEQEGINHIFHHWIDPKTKQPYEAMYGKFSKGLPQAKQRTIPTYEAGEAAGMKPATTNLGKLIGLEWESVMRAHQTRQMIKTLHHIGADPDVSIQLRTGKAPKPIRMIENWSKLQNQDLTDGYIPYSHPALRKPITFKSGDRLVTIQGEIGIRKELHPFVKAYVENPNYNTLDQLNFATKSMKLGMSMFHVVSLGAQEIANWRIPFKNIPRGRRLIKELDPDMRLLHQEGLDLWKGYEDIGYQKKFFQGKTWVGKTGNVAAYPITLMRSFIFDVVQPGMKASFAYDKFQKMLPKYLKKGYTKEQAARAAVKAADGHFSHEHWKRSLLETNRWMVKAYFSPQSRRWWQRMLLSPTWQREHLLVAKDVAKSFMPDKMIRKLKLEEMGPIKSEYRKYALGAVTMIAAVDLYNLMMTKEMDGKAKHIWQNPKGKGFAVRAPWNEPSYTVETKDGKKRTIKGGPGYIRPLKSVFEVAESARDPIKKIGYKVSPMVSAIGQQFWPSKYRKEYKGIEAMPRRALDFVLDIGTPIQVGQMSRYLAGKKSLPGAILPFVGMPTSKYVKKKKDKALSPWEVMGGVGKSKKRKKGVDFSKYLGAE